MQITRALREVKNGKPAVQVCRKLGITQTTFYRWRKRHGASGAEPRSLLALREENEKLRQVVANLLLEKLSLKTGSESS